MVRIAERPVEQVRVSVPSTEPFDNVSAHPGIRIVEHLQHGSGIRLTTGDEQCSFSPYASVRVRQVFKQTLDKASSVGHGCEDLEYAGDVLLLSLFHEP